MKIGKKGYKGKPYHGGGVYMFLDVDIDRLSYFELRNCLKELGYEPGQCVLYMKLPRSTTMLEIKSDYDTTLIAECLSHGDILDCFVCHFVTDPVLVPPSLEYGESGVGEGASQNSQENASNPSPAPANSNTSSPVHSFTVSNTSPLTHQTPTPIHPSIDPTLDPVLLDSIPDPIHPSNEQDSDRESLNGRFNGSDVDDVLRSFREEMSTRKRRKKGERVQLPDHINLGTKKKKGQILGMMNL
ncbi:hypothetical protein R3W88_032362 [Solanum pinnatisectum]|uniref:PB1-like domain-containing protein n=1 Tax=Solanum pinnatisectum TaxID=50273 RepID=A0AAV9LSJ1_9SOLN|nr:hypothetical protein R3W88_032362 [Solanum pinnatisectum]